MPESLSEVPDNALSDAMVLRAYALVQERSWPKLSDIVE